MAYTTIDDPTAFFNTLLYTGNGGSSRDLTFSANAGDFQADWLWFKQRSQSSRSHNVYDSVRGNSQRIETDNTGAEEEQTGLHKTFNTNGFTIGSGNIVNENNQTFVTWGWKAGTSFSNDASSTGVGNIDSAGSVNTDAGFSIITYTGSSSTNTVAHGLGVAPTMMIIKNRTSAYEWAVFHQDLAANHNLYLNTTAAAAQSDVGDIWSSTAPSSTVFTVTGNDIYVNYGSQNYVAYCFAEKQGYSKFGSYTGNGNANGPFVYTGFKPAWVLCKKSSATGDWELYDNKRNGFNGGNVKVIPNANDAETGVGRLSLLSNGFFITTSSGNLNTNGADYIYLAFAENPFVTSTGVPTNAR